MIDIDQVEHLHIEFSGNCNSRCTKCPRNIGGYNYNTGFVETDLSYEIIKKRILPSFIKQLKKGILINGNYGDFVLNHESLDIIRYFRDSSELLPINISTNGSARNADFWKELGKLKCKISFCLDGLSDTHSIYRQDTNWEKIIVNATNFINAGGEAIWKMIKFQHNEHQIEKCKELSQLYNFSNFELVDHGRDSGPIYNKKGIFESVMGQEKNSENKIITYEENAVNQFTKITRIHTEMFYQKGDILSTPTCKTKEHKSIYISADARVFPCCWTGLTSHFSFPIQIAPMIENKNNDLNYYTLEECIQWFSFIEESWKLSKWSKGRTRFCDDHCFDKNYMPIYVQENKISR